jgi:hypothetical protein
MLTFSDCLKGKFTVTFWEKFISILETRVNTRDFTVCTMYVHSCQHDLQWVVALDGAFRQTLLHFLIVAGFACISSKSEPHFLRPPSLLHSWAVRL